MPGSPHDPRAPKRRPEWLDRELKEGQPSCARCKKGQHSVEGEPILKVGCLGGRCGCFCNFPSVRPTNQLPPWPYQDGFGDALRTLAAAGVEVLAVGAPEFRLIWRPKPSLWPDDLHGLLRAYAIDLVHVLWPDSSARAHHDFWSQGGLAGCVCCGMSTCAIDPLGRPRHRRCGFHDG